MRGYAENNPFERERRALGRAIKEIRLKKKMTQEEFAKFLQERESSVIKWEQGTMKPDMEVARKLEKILGVRLVEVEEGSTGVVQQGKKGDDFTLGDFIKVRKRSTY